MANPYGNRFSHQNVTLSSETLALIAGTEETPVKELASFATALTVFRVRDTDGNPIPRRFTCTAEGYDLREYSSTAGTKFAAERGLRRQFELLGWSVVWTAVRDYTDGEPEVESVEPVFVTPREVPNLEPGMNLHTPATVSDEPGEHEAPEHGLVHKLPKLDCGRVTPVSDPDAYRAIYFAAFTLASNGFVSPFTQDKALFDLGEKSGVEGRGRTLRRHIAQVMASGEAGTSVGIPAVAVDPWALVDQSDARWIRVLHLPDPTTKGARKGDGERRESFSTNLSGLPDTDRARLWLERREANRYVGTKGRNTVGAKAERTQIRLQCHLAAKAAKEIAVAGGEDEMTADLQYKWVYAATCRNLGDLHSVFEAQLAEQGVTEQMILDYAAAQKAA